MLEKITGELKAVHSVSVDFVRILYSKTENLSPVHKKVKVKECHKL
jgi:hypothetical protein